MSKPVSSSTWKWQSSLLVVYRGFSSKWVGFKFGWKLYLPLSQHNVPILRLRWSCLLESPMNTWNRSLGRARCGTCLGLKLLPQMLERRVCTFATYRKSPPHSCSTCSGMECAEIKIFFSINGTKNNIFYIINFNIGSNQSNYLNCKFHKPNNVVNYDYTLNIL